MSTAEIQTILKAFTQDRPTLADNNTPGRLMDLLQIETEEARAELDNPVNLANELADIVIFALNIANEYGFDMEEEIRRKIAYNHTRYNAADFQTGNYEEARKLGKSREADVKPLFYD